jgi:hypothetical protein
VTEGFFYDFVIGGSVVDEVDACSGALEMLNPHMKSWGIFEATRRKAEQLLAEQHSEPQPTQTLPVPGSMEWLAAKNKSS